MDRHDLPDGPETKWHPPARTDRLLKCAEASIASIDVNAVECFSRLTAWKEAFGSVTSAHWDSIVGHIANIQEHAIGIQDELAFINDPPGRSQKSSVAVSCVDGEGANPLGEEELLQLDEREVYDAFQFETELREMFGFHFIDGELDSALLPAMNLVVEKADVATKEGLAIAALRKLIQSHPRAFGHYFAGSDRPYPRSSKEVQAEIDAKLPTYIAHLQEELEEAIEDERRNVPADLISS
jgi:hypothetical protein